MSDKSYIPSSGQTYSVRKMGGGKYGVENDTPLAVVSEPERIDHQTQRVLWEKSDVCRKLIWVFESRGKRVLSWPGGSMELDAVDLSESSSAGGNRLKPLKLTMPGKVITVHVKAGDIVEAEQNLLIVEAMKMENLMLAPARAKIAKVHVAPGDRLESGMILITFESAD